ncbi:MAG: hypothetical protein KBC64_01670 [Simkaniaceae bacterium]|nr:hypothetical protein [Simkaniaceae bacterium]
MKYYGVHACLALFEKRPQDLIRVYLDETNIRDFKKVLKWCAEHKKAYHLIPSSELDKVSDSVHHEGVCFLAKALPILKEADLLPAILNKKGKICLLYLDGVQNPHNIGSILRTAAHFGVTHILGAKGRLPFLTPSACRIAKGGAEAVSLVMLENPEETLKKLKGEGFSLIGTSSHQGTSLYAFTYPPRSILAMGGETTGLTPECSSLMSHQIEIPGTGEVESLNVSVATALCLGEYCRQHQGPQ